MKYVRDEELIVAFGQNLKRLRNEKGLSQEELANRADMEHSQILRIENGKVNTSISVASAIAKALDLHIKDLFDY